MKKRLLLAMVGLLICALVGSALFAVTHVTHVHASSSGDCGVERWSVKTGSDPDVGLINLQSKTPTTIAALASLPTPSTLPPNNRIQPTETTIYQVQATLTIFKLEDDSDYHLVLDDGAGHTMITEIPDPLCVDSSSPLLPGIQKARSEFDAKYNPTTTFQTANVPVTVTGVGFFDSLHGQAGVAPNGIELHPVLDVQFCTCGTPAPTPTPTPVPTPAPTPTPVANNLIQNWSFETTGGWTFAGQPLPVRTTTQAHSGNYSLQVGATSGQQGDSTASQMVTLPSPVTKATLSFFYWPATNDSSTFGWQEADILNSQGQVVQQLFQKTTNDRAWLQLTFDLSKYAGQTIGVQFLDHEASNGLPFYTYMYVDDVVLTAQ